MEIQNNYPTELSDQELLEKIKELNKMVTRVTKPGSNYSLGPSYYLSMMQLGQYELTKRIQANLLQEISRQRESNRRVQLINWFLSALTIILAIVTIHFGRESIKYAKSDQESDLEWQREQIFELKNQNSELKKFNLFLEELIQRDSISDNETTLLQ